MKKQLAISWLLLIAIPIVFFTSNTVRADGQISAEAQKKLDSNLLEAAAAQDLEKVKELLSQGATVDAVDKFGNSALMKAAAGGHLALVYLLLENDAKIDLKNSKGKTALDLAQESGNAEVITALMGSSSLEEEEKDDDDDDDDDDDFDIEALEDALAQTDLVGQELVKPPSRLVVFLRRIASPFGVAVIKIGDFFRDLW